MCPNPGEEFSASRAEAGSDQELVSSALAKYGINFNQPFFLTQALHPRSRTHTNVPGFQHLGFHGAAALEAAVAVVTFNASEKGDDGKLLAKAAELLAGSGPLSTFAKKLKLDRISALVNGRSSEDSRHGAIPILHSVLGAIHKDAGFKSVLHLVNQLYGADGDIPSSHLASLRLLFVYTSLKSIGSLRVSARDLRDSFDITFPVGNEGYIRDAFAQHDHKGTAEVAFSRVHFVGDRIFQLAQKEQLLRQHPDLPLRDISAILVSKERIHIDDLDRRIKPGETAVVINSDPRFSEFMAYRGYLRSLFGALAVAGDPTAALSLAAALAPALERRGAQQELVRHTTAADLDPEPALRSLLQLYHVGKISADFFDSPIRNGKNHRCLLRFGGHATYEGRGTDQRSASAAAWRSAWDDREALTNKLTRRYD